MSQPLAFCVQFEGGDPFNFGVTSGAQGTSVGPDSQELAEHLQDTLDHYRTPVSTAWNDPFTRFTDLKQRWEEETATFSSMTDIVLHPAYQQIIGMGEKALPFIMAELIDTPGHWFWALKAITGEDPVPNEHRGNLAEMTNHWVAWLFSWRAYRSCV